MFKKVKNLAIMVAVQMLDPDEAAESNPYVEDIARHGYEDGYDLQDAFERAANFEEKKENGQPINNTFNGKIAHWLHKKCE